MKLDPKKYFINYDKLIFDENIYQKLAKFADTLQEIRASGARLIFAGNGASCAISSHAALDFTKQGKLEALTFTDPALVSAYSNDFGFENALVEMFNSYRKDGDLIILVSTSGNSSNVVNLAHRARQIGHTVVSFTGKNASNELKQNSDIAFWVDSHAYNIVENIHMIWLGYLIDSLVGKEVYEVS